MTLRRLIASAGALLLLTSVAHAASCPSSQAFRQAKRVCSAEGCDYRLTIDGKTWEGTDPFGDENVAMPTVKLLEEHQGYCDYAFLDASGKETKEGVRLGVAASGATH